MKKFIKLTLLIIFFSVLIGCASPKRKAEVSFELVEGSLKNDTVALNVIFSDPDNYISEKIYIKLLDQDGNELESRNYNSIDDISLLVYNELLSETSYLILVSTSLNGDEIVLNSYTFTTKKDSNIKIYDAEDFLQMSQDRSGNYILMNDIDFSGVQFTSPFTSAFNGTFNGQGYTLKNIEMTTSYLYNGVFGYVASGTIRDLKLENISIGTNDDPVITSSSTKTAILVGYQSTSLSTIENITITSSQIYLESLSQTFIYSGIIAGESRGLIRDIEVIDSYVYLKSSSNAVVKLGGAVGYINESSEIYDIKIESKIDFQLDSEISNRDNHDFNIYIGGISGDVEPALKKSSSISGIYLTSEINVLSLNFNYDETDYGTHTVLIGGLFGSIDRNFDNIYSVSDIEFNYNSENKDNTVKEYISVSAIAVSVNTYNEISNVLIYSSSINIQLTFEADIEVSEYVINSPLKRHEFFTFQGSSILIDGIEKKEDLLMKIDSLDGFFTNDFIVQLINLD